ncbi:MAG TPA: hypothetical protein VFQ45_20375 [Longimicrobium sp.]|nr:hypothetical protein [Longimicrobium sp.]
MGRIHAFEIEDQAWCPAPIRDAATDFLQFALHLGNQYAPIAPLLADALRRAGTTRIIDLCAGGGGPWSRLLPALHEAGIRSEVCLTDRFPNHEAFRAASERSGGALSFEPEPVDATAVPSHLRGLRTVFTAFHHFEPEAARAILLDAVRARQPIAVFEATERTAPAVAGMVFSPLLTLGVTPFIRPRRISRILLTYLLPVVPLVVLWDGVVSCLRTYSVPELEKLVAGIPESGTYDWSIGKVKSRAPVPVTYLIGVPAGG